MLRKVHEEIDREIGCDRPPSMSDRANLPYTEATLLESQRLASITPQAVPHAPIEDTTLCGYHIPKGTMIIPNTWRVHHDPKLWPEPFMLKPERFINAEGKVFKPDHFIPFSIGPRACLGESLARQELFIFFTIFMQKYRVENPPGNDPPSLEETVPGLIIKPQNYKLIAHAR